MKKAFRFLQLELSEDAMVKELNEMYQQVIAFVADDILDRIAQVDFRIKT